MTMHNMQQSFVLGNAYTNFVYLVSNTRKALTDLLDLKATSQMPICLKMSKDKLPIQFLSSRTWIAQKDLGGWDYLAYTTGEPGGYDSAVEVPTW